jgi:signal peptidase II
MTPLQRRRVAIACSVAVCVAAIDQISKYFAIAYLSETARIDLIGDLLGLQLAFNPGSIMSLGPGITWIYTVLGIAATVILFFVARRTQSTAWAVAIGFVWGGAVGNLIDRLVAEPGFARGYVTDFLAYGNLFIGNIADIALGVGVGLGILLLLRNRTDQSGTVQTVDAPANE